MASNGICRKCGKAKPIGADGYCADCQEAEAYLDAGPELPQRQDETVVLDRDRLRSDAVKKATSFGGEVKAFGEYDLVEGIARGGMGAVYKARHRKLQRTVALKVILSGALAGEDEIKRFRMEVEAAAQLDHPNIVPIFDVGQIDGQHYFTMRLIDGGGLTEHIERFQSDPRSAARLMVRIARAVHYAHQRGILHRDLKPDNILIDREGEPQITDFGLAKRVEDKENLTVSGAVMGTPTYMAPEQARGTTRRLTTAVDVYSLGAILYQMLVGKPPFQGTSPLDTLRMVVEQDPASPKQLNDAVDEDLATICLKCLAKEPEKRYSSAEAFAEDLERWLKHEPIVARPATTLERAIKLTQRHPVAAMSATLVLAGLVIFIVTIVVNEQRLEEERDIARDLELVATQQAKIAEERAEQARTRLVRLNVGNALRLFDQGDSSGAVLWLLEALRLDSGKSWREELQRIRINSVINECPKLHSFTTETEPLLAAAATPDGKRVITFSADKARYWNGQTGKSEGSINTHDIAIEMAAVSPDGDRAVASTGKRNAIIWEIKSGKRIATLKHDRDLNYVGFSPDGSHVVTCSEDRTAQVWDARTGAAVGKPLVHRDGVTFAAFSPDGRKIATASRDKTCAIWETATGRAFPSTSPIRHGIGAINRVAFSPDGRRILTAGQDRAARLWDVASGEMIGGAMSHNGPVILAEFSPDGERVVTANTDNSARIWSATTTDPLISPVAHSTRLVRVSFSPDGRKLLTVSERGARVWDAQTGQPATPPMQSHEEVLYGGFGEEGRFVIVVSKDQTIRVWDAVAHGQDERTLQGTYNLRDAVFSADGRQMATAAGDTLRVWSIADRRLSSSGIQIASRDRPGLQILAATFMPDPNFIATVNSDSSVMFWNIKESRLLPRTIQLRHEVALAEFSTPAKRLATAGFDRGARLWDLDKGKLIGAPLKHEGRITALAFGNHGRILAVGSEDGVARMVNADNGQIVGEPMQHTAAIEAISFNPDGSQLVTASRDGTARVWDAATGRALGPPLEHEGEVFHALFSPDGKNVITSSADNSARVWDAAKAEPVTPLLQHNGWVLSAVFSPNGAWVATVSADNSARLWDATTGEPLTPSLHHNGRLNFALFTPNGKGLLTGSPEGNARLWSIAPDTRPLPHLISLAQLLSGRRIDPTGTLAPVKLPTLVEAWKLMVDMYPRDLISSPQETVEWHRHEAEVAAETKDWFGAVFHLERMVAMEPRDPVLRKRLQTAKEELESARQAATSQAP